jgi:hypothetical protein
MFQHGGIVNYPVGQGGELGEFGEFGGPPYALGNRDLVLVLKTSRPLSNI